MNGSVPKRAIILVGFMGAGKSSVGRALAGQIGWQFEDLDASVERREGRTVAEIFRDAGELEFRRAEHAALQALLREVEGGKERVIALGGGAFAHEPSAGLIEEAKVPTVFLDANPEELWKRCTEQAEREGMQRPLLASRERFQELYEKRRRHYLQASLRQETSGKPVEEIAAELRSRLGFDGEPAASEQP